MQSYKLAIFCSGRTPREDGAAFQCGREPRGGRKEEKNQKKKKTMRGHIETPP